MYRISISKSSNCIYGFAEANLASKVTKELFSVEKIKYDISYNIITVSKYVIRRLNRENRGIDKVTDVLSFPSIDFNKPSDFSKYVHNGKIDISILDLNNNTIFLGDVIICYDKVLSQAKKYNHSIKREYAFLLTHSLLHLLGYDHMNEKDENIMFEKQERVLNNLKILR